MPDDELTGDPIPNAANEATDPAAARAAFLANPPEVIPSEPEPVVDDEQAALDELAPKPAAPAAPAAPVVDDPFAPYGGRQAVETAHQVAEALRTETGLRLLMRQGLEALGYSDEQIKAALGAGPGGPVAPAAAAPAPAGPFDDIADEEVITGAEAKTLAERAAQVAVERALAQARAELEPVKQAQAQQRVAEQNVRNDATLVELLGPPPEDPAALAEYQGRASAVLATAQNFLDPNSWDPAAIRNAIVQGHAAYTAEQERRFQAYLATKRQARTAAPTNIGGQTPTEAEPKEPKNLAESRALARASGLFDQ